MRLNELIGKEMVNIYDGMRMGTVGDSDMVIDEESGQIVSIILPNKGNAFNFWTDRQNWSFPGGGKENWTGSYRGNLDSTHMRLKTIHINNEKGYMSRKA